MAVEAFCTAFGSKADLLAAALDVAVVGDGAPVPIAARPKFATLGTGDRADRMRARRPPRAGPTSGRTASGGRCATPRAPTRRSRPDSPRANSSGRQNVADGAAFITARPVDQYERDGLWAVTSTEVYDLLVGRVGWRNDDYEDRLAATIDHLLPEEAEDS